jgi:hypothetical protein
LSIRSADGLSGYRVSSCVSGVVGCDCGRPAAAAAHAPVIVVVAAAAAGPQVREQFNPISENQKIGSDRELDDEEEYSPNKPSPQAFNRSLTSTQFQVRRSVLRPEKGVNGQGMPCCFFLLPVSLGIYFQKTHVYVAPQ